MWNQKFVRKALDTFGSAFVASVVIAAPSFIETGDYSTTALVAVGTGALTVAFRIVSPFFSPFLTLGGEKPLDQEGVE